MAKSRIVFTEHEDDMIRRAYSVGCYGTGQRGPMSLATRLNKSPSSIYRRAAKLGVLRHSHKKTTRFWTAEEELVVETNAHKELEAINHALRRAGYESRSLESIHHKVRSLGIKLRENRADNGIYSQNQLADLMGINQNVVRRYIHEGSLKGKVRKGIEQIEYQIKALDIRRFFKEYTSMIDVAKCDKYWLVDILTGEIK